MRSEVVVTGFSFTESVRWHDGKLWFADMHEGKVFILDGEQADVVFELPGFVSGLGWLGSGELIVASMLDRKLLRVSGEETEVHADLLTVAEYHLNDLLIDDDHCYSVNFGFDAFVGAPPAPASIVHVAPDRSVSRATDPYMFPNGMVITDGGATFLVAESFGDRIIAFDRADDGSLSNSRTWAAVPEGCIPDGIEIDAEGHVWVPGAGDNHLRLVAEGGEVLEDVDLGDRLPISLAFGGADRRTLYVATCETFSPFESREKSSASIEAIAVDVPGPPTTSG